MLAVPSRMLETADPDSPVLCTESPESRIFQIKNLYQRIQN